MSWPRSGRQSAVLLAGVLGIVLVSCQGEPGYRGRTSREWMTALGDSSPLVRVQAADALGHVLEIAPRSPHVVRALIATLADSVDRVRMAAATALVAQGVRAEGAVPGLHAALHDSAHAHVRAQAASILGSLGPAAGEGSIPVLIEAVADDSPEVRAAALHALAAFGSAALIALPEIRSRLDDASPSVRLRALEALTSVEAADTVVVPAVRNALSDSTAAVRASAAYLLGGLRAAAGPAVDALVVALGDPDAEVRAAAAYALGEIGPVARAAVPLLRVLLGDPDPRVRQLSKDALARIESRT